jgi:hypothetical protein
MYADDGLFYGENLVAPDENMFETAGIRFHLPPSGRLGEIKICQKGWSLASSTKIPWYGV